MVSETLIAENSFFVVAVYFSRMEDRVKSSIEGYLIQKGWNITNGRKGKHEHGVDIRAFHKRWREILLLEVKGENGNEKEN